VQLFPGDKHIIVLSLSRVAAISLDKDGAASLLVNRQHLLQVLAKLDARFLLFLLLLLASLLFDYWADVNLSLLVVEGHFDLDFLFGHLQQEVLRCILKL